MSKDIRDLLNGIKDGTVSIEEAELELKKAPFVDTGYAKVDMHRGIRQGAGEVIYGAGKSAEQIIGIVNTMKDNGQNNILITRIDADKSSIVQSKISDYKYYESGRVAVVGDMPAPDGKGMIAVVTGGTSDIPVADEAYYTAMFLGNEVSRIYDVGVAGIHRLMSNLDGIMQANVIIAVAGMEGALASVVGGLVDRPVIAVPTSVGYGASFGGLSALLSMLNSCASGVSVVNIDNGFGAAYQASMINH